MGQLCAFAPTRIRVYFRAVKGRAKVPIGKVFNIDEIVEAHGAMEENKAGGKIVITT